MRRPNKETLTKWACDLLIKRVRYETACLQLPGSSLDETDRDTAIIRRSTEVFTESWIVPLLEAIRDGNYEAVYEMVR